LGLHAVALSRASGLWVAMKIATNVADGSGRVEVHPERVVPVPVRGEDGGEPYRHRIETRMLGPTLDAMERTREGVRLDVARRYVALNGLNRIVGGAPGDRIGIVAAGKTFLDLRQALRTLGLDDAELARRGVRLLHLAVVHPLEPEIVARFAAGLREIIVVEEKRPLIETAIKDLLYGRPDAPAVRGKRNPDGSALFPGTGELDADLIARRLAPVLAGMGDFPSVRAWLDGAGRAGRARRRWMLARTRRRRAGRRADRPAGRARARGDGGLPRGAGLAGRGRPGRAGAAPGGAAAAAAHAVLLLRLPAQLLHHQDPGGVA